MEVIEANVSEHEFAGAVRRLADRLRGKGFELVTGPGRSGAVASAYMSHALGIPFVPFKHIVDDKKFLIVDTVVCTGKTRNRAVNWYDANLMEAEFHTLFLTERKYSFWFENTY